MNKNKNKNFILLGICGFLAIVSISITIQVATSGIEMKKLQTIEFNLITERKSLEEEFVKNSSITNLQDKSAEYGFITPDNLVYVVGAAKVAKLP